MSVESLQNILNHRIGRRIGFDLGSGLLFAFCFGLYLISMPKSIALEDDSLFILSGYFNGVSHPPGYPLYTLMLHLFTNIPIGEVAARAHASSAFFAALGCVVLYRILTLLGLQPWSALLTCVAFAVTANFWSQAIIAEVYSLNLVLNFSLLYYALKIHRQFDPLAPIPAGLTRDCVFFSVLLGLALANHWPLTVLAAPAYLLLVARPVWQTPNKLALTVPAVFVSMGFYVWLYINNQASPAISFSGEFGGMRDLIDFILRSHYASVDQNPSAGIADKLQFFRDIAVMLLRELNLLLLFALYGLYRALGESRTRLYALAWSWMVIANSFGLVLLIHFDYSDLFRVVFKVYTLVSIGALFVAAGFGLADAARRIGPGLRAEAWLLVPGLCIVINLVLSLPQNFRHDYSWGQEYAQRILSEIPNNAIVFADGEIELGLLAYYHRIEGQRPDIELYSSSALLLDNRLFDYRLADKREYIENFVAMQSDRPIFAANNYYQVPALSRTLFLDRLGRPPGKTQNTLSSEDIALILQWTDNNDDVWTRLALEELRHRAIRFLTPALKRDSSPEIRQFAADAINRLIRSPAGVLQFVKALVDGQAVIDTLAIRRYLDPIDAESLAQKRYAADYVYLDRLSVHSEQTATLVDAARQAACEHWQSYKNDYCRSSPDSSL